MSKILSGPVWVARFPNSNRTDDLAEPFRSNAEKFIAALKAARATVSVNATLRPKERAFLMHFSYLVGKDGEDPERVPEMGGVDIDWVHRDAAGKKDSSASQKAAALMAAGYGIVFRPAAVSHHSDGTAIDMNIFWTAAELKVKDGAGNLVTLKTGARNGGNPELHVVGKSYGVIKLVSDAPHWSNDGH